MGVNDVTTNRNTGFINEILHGGPTVSVNAGQSDVPQGAAINTDDLMKTLKNPKAWSIFGMGPSVDSEEGVTIPDGMGAKMAETLQRKQDAFDGAKTDYANELKDHPDLGPEAKLGFEAKIKQTQANLDQYKVNCQSAISQGKGIQDAESNLQTMQENLAGYTGSDPQAAGGLQLDVTNAQNQLQLLKLQFKATLHTCAPLDPREAQIQSDLAAGGYETCNPELQNAYAQNNPALTTMDPNSLAYSKAASLATSLGEPQNQQILAQLKSVLGMAPGPLTAQDVQTFNQLAQQSQAGMGVGSGVNSNEMGGAVVANAESQMYAQAGVSDPNAAQEISNSTTISYLQGQIANLLQQNAQLSGNTLSAGRYGSICG